MEDSVKFAVIHPHVWMCAFSSIHGGRKITSDLLAFPSVQTENNTEHSMWLAALPSRSHSLP